MSSKPRLVSTLTALMIIWTGHMLVDIMIGFWTVYKTLAHFDLAIAGLIAGVCPFIGEGMQIFFGSLGDKGYRKALLIFGLGACAASTLLAYTENYILLFLLFLTTCMGSGAFHPTAVAITGSMTKHRKGLFVTIFASGGAVGLAASHMIFTYWYQNYNGKTLVLALPFVLLIGYILLIELPGARPEPTPKGRRYGLTAMKRLFSCPELVTLYASQVCVQVIYWGTMFLLPDVLASKGYEPWISFGGGHFFYIMGGAVMMIPGGILSDIYPPKQVLFAASLLGVLFYYLFLLSPMLPTPLALLLLFCLGACLGLANPVAVAFGNRMMPSRPGLVSAFLMGLVWCVAESVGPGGGGLLTKCFVENAPTKALLCFGGFFVASMIITLFLPANVTEEIQIDYA